MKRIFIMDDNGIKEYVPVDSQKKKNTEVSNKSIEDKVNEDKLLTIADLVQKFRVTRPTIYAWMEKGLLKKIPLGGRVLFHPEDINGLIENMRDISS
jgi:predicted DNA-binding transcriptional regulator AlpA